MIVGIDLGTTHSLVGAHGPQGPQLFRNALGEVLTPSAVSVDDDGTLLVGRPALERAVSHPQASVAAFKRWMGSDRETVLGRHRLRPEELSALVLKALVADAEAATGERVTEAVISVPAYFSDGQRRATRAAGELAGIRVERLVNEPTAAALAYGLAATGREGRYLVFDLGGGTFDVSILEMFDGVMEVHASAGDNFLGGEDFLKAMHEAWLADAQLGGRKLTPSEDAQLLRRLEDAKRALVQGGEAAVQLRVADRDIAWTIDEARFAKLCDPLVQRLRAPLERAMRDAGLLPNQLDELVMVGGASRMPLAARLLARMFGQLPLRHVNPDEAIALGAAIAAGMKARDESLDEVVLTDVCPYTLGVGTSREIGSGQFVHGVFSPIIQRNSTVPVSRVETYHPIHAQQRVVEFEIFQGESPRTEHNVSLGRLSVPLPKPGIEGNAVDVRFTYDVNGVLQVEAKVQGAETVHEVVLENSPGSLTPAEIRERLARLDDIKVHPRDQQANLQVMAQAERMYAELLWAREPLQAALADFRSVLERQDPREIERSRTAFAEMLVDLEAGG